MNCSNCGQTSTYTQGYNPALCSSDSGCFIDAGCVAYNGPNLACSNILTGDALDVILQKIDPLLCAATGDYSSYNTYCLSPISTQKEFVESISNYVCNLNSDFQGFITGTFPTYQTSVTNSINAINNPNLNLCASSGIISSDTLNGILTKLANKICDIYDNQLDLSAVPWNSCYTVSPAPTTLEQAFTVLIGQICLLKTTVNNNTAAPPTFNNTGSCLSGGGATDSIAVTINLIKTRLCQTGTISNSGLTFGCTTAPGGADNNLQGTLQAILTQLTLISQATPRTWSGDFSVTNVDNSNLCLGKSIAITPPLVVDRFVAATTSDLSPGTLQDKLQAGTNVTIDYVTVPGKAIINATGGGGGGDGTVLADVTDTTPDFLLGKVEGTGDLGITITPVLDTTISSNHKVNFIVTVNPVTLFTALIQAAQADSGLQAAFCALVAGCPSPCSAPTNVTVSYASGTTSTTTTTTTT